MSQVVTKHARAIIREKTCQRPVSIEIEAPSKEACEAACEQYFDRRHPLGHGTSISSPQMSAEGLWQADSRADMPGVPSLGITGAWNVPCRWRQASCD